MDFNQHWAKISQRIHWIKPWDKLSEVSFSKPVSIKWYLNGKLNVCFNCVDRHLEQQSQKTALVWVPDNPSQPSQSLSFKELHLKVVEMAWALKALGIRRGDRITIYLPMIPDAAVAMLACARIGAIHNVVFAGFAPEALQSRIQDSQSALVITSVQSQRCGKTSSPLSNVREALALGSIKIKTLVLPYPDSSEESLSANQNDPESEFSFSHLRKSFSETLKKKSLKELSDETLEEMDSEDPLFMLYTSGSTAKPKGVLHTSGGYLTYASYTHDFIFKPQPHSVYWCTADVGWITGHTYIVYGPLSNGTTTVLFEGVPNYPNPSRCWEIVDQLGVDIFYTAPTAIRSLLKEGNEWVLKTNRKSLRILGSVGEPINPEAWQWYSQVVGEGRCSVIDTWWQTETGGVLICPQPEKKPLKPGSAQLPLPGVQVELLDEKGKAIEGPGTGALVLTASWPGQMRTVFGDHQRFEQTYFETFPGKYFSGDRATRDQDGDIWINGRMDDVLNVSGHRIGTAELESCLNAFPKVAESAVVGFPHDLKGQGIHAFVILKSGEAPESEDFESVRQWVAKHLSPIAKPDRIEFVESLPKTRSGKIMRRILRKIAEGDFENLGDLSTLNDPEGAQKLIEKVKSQKV